jgi:hypothetical protein
VDQDPTLRPEYLSAPTIVAPENNDAFDGQTVTVSGTADREVSVRLWDWLSPAATTTADGSGRWSITLQDVEPGDHMYCAEAFRNGEKHSERSKIVAVRVTSPTRAPSEQARRTSLRWKLPPTEFARKLSRRRRSDRVDGVGTHIPPAEGLQPTATVHPPTPSRETANSLSSSEAKVASAEDAPPPELPALAPVAPLDVVPEPKAVPDDPPIEIRASTVPDESEVIGTFTRALAEPPAPIDLGVADQALEPAPPLDAAIESVAVPIAAQRVWTERIIVEQLPTI